MPEGGDKRKRICFMGEIQPSYIEIPCVNFHFIHRLRRALFSRCINNLDRTAACYDKEIHYLRIPRHTDLEFIQRDIQPMSRQGKHVGHVESI